VNTIYINKIAVKDSMAQIGIATQTELAERLGITKNQLSLMLSEKYNPFKIKYQELCEILKIQPEALLYEYEPQEDNSLKINHNRSNITAIELFAGGGGLALGLEEAGIETLAHVEFDKGCCETLKVNRPNWNVICKDISEVDFTEYRNKIDIVTGGFPCQAFSYAGKKMGFEDTRGTLFYEFARCIAETQPLMFMAENVRGLISHDEGRTLSTIMEIFKELGYNVQYKLLKTVEYEVPQKRERIVIVGSKDGINFSYPEKNKNMKTLKDALFEVPISEGQKYSESKKAVFDLVPPGGCWRDLPEDVKKTYMGKSYYSGGGRTGMARRISWDEPCLTLTCSPSQKQTDRCHPDEVRPFTVREYARIQTFPDNWQFCGGIGDRYKQIGNAVPVLLAKKLGNSLKDALLEYRKSL